MTHIMVTWLSHLVTWLTLWSHNHQFCFLPTCSTILSMTLLLTRPGARVGLSSVLTSTKTCDFWMMQLLRRMRWGMDDSFNCSHTCFLFSMYLPHPTHLHHLHTHTHTHTHTQSHAGKVVLRSWYERNKHIFPASRWEPYDPEKQWDKYTVSRTHTTLKPE